MVKYHRMTEQEFQQIKVMDKAGLTNNQIAAVLKNTRSTGTINAAKKFESLAAYKTAQMERMRKIRGTPPTDKKPEAANIPSPRPPISKEDALLKVMTRIADTLEELVEAWNSKPQGRRIF